MVAYREQARAVHEQGGGVRLAQLDELGVPVLQQALARFKAGEIGGAVELKIGGRNWIGLIAELPGHLAQPLYLAVAAPRDELLTDAERILREGTLISIAMLVLVVPLVWLLARRVAQPLRRLAKRSKRSAVSTFVRRWRCTRACAKSTSSRNRWARSKTTIANFLDIGSALAGERDFDRLLASVCSTKR